MNSSLTYDTVDDDISKADTWPKQSQSCATLATTNMPPSFKATSMDLSAHIGYPTAPKPPVLSSMPKDLFEPHLGQRW